MNERNKKLPCAETWREKDSADPISEENYFKDCPVFT